MDISKRTLRCSLWNGSLGANKNDVELASSKKVPSTLFQVMAHRVQLSNCQGLKGRFDSAIWYIPNFMMLKSILKDNSEPGIQLSCSWYCKRPALCAETGQREDSVSFVRCCMRRSDCGGHECSACEQEASGAGEKQTSPLLRSPWNTLKHLS